MKEEREKRRPSLFISHRRVKASQLRGRGNFGVTVSVYPLTLLFGIYFIFQPIVDQLIGQLTV
jgi:hypothetical protein